jgi:hypothetical protein
MSGRQLNGFGIRFDREQILQKEFLRSFIRKIEYDYPRVTIFYTYPFQKKTGMVVATAAPRKRFSWAGT